MMEGLFCYDCAQAAVLSVVLDTANAQCGGCCMVILSAGVTAYKALQR